MEKSTAACAATDERFYGLELNPSVVNAAAIPASAATPIALPPPTFLLGRATGSSSAGILSNGRGAYNLPLRPGLEDAMNADLVADFASAMNSALMQNPQLVSDDPMAGFERLYIGKDDTRNDSVKAAVSPPMREQGSPNSAAATLRGPSLLPDSDGAVHDFQSACKDSVVHGGSRGGEADNLADDAWWKRSLAGRKSRGPLSTSTSSMIQKPTRRSSAPGFAETAIYSPFEALASIDLEVVKNSRPKRRNVKISTEPQTVSARHRRMKISDRMRVLQRLVPGGTKMDTASMLDEAISYVKFLKDKLEKFQTVSNAAGGAFGVEHQNLLDVRPGQLYRSSPLGFHPPLPMDCATVVSQGLSSAPQKFETLCTPGYPIDTFRSARSSFADNAYREQFCH